MGPILLKWMVEASLENTFGDFQASAIAGIESRLWPYVGGPGFKVLLRKGLWGRQSRKGESVVNGEPTSWSLRRQTFWITTT